MVEVSPGVRLYAAPSLRPCVKTNQPLLDTGQTIKSLYGPTAGTQWRFRDFAVVVE